MKADRELIACRKRNPSKPSPITSRGRLNQFLRRRRDWVYRSSELRKGHEMRIFAALLIVLAVLYFWDVNYNHGTLSDGLISMERSMFHSMGH
jgi:hypothetical protein